MHRAELLAIEPEYHHGIFRREGRAGLCKTLKFGPGAGPDVTADQLRHRSWWQGSDLYLLIDDYDLVAGANGSGLEIVTEEQYQELVQANAAKPATEKTDDGKSEKKSKK